MKLNMIPLAFVGTSKVEQLSNILSGGTGNAPCAIVLDHHRDAAKCASRRAHAEANGVVTEHGYVRLSWIILRTA